MHRAVSIPALVACAIAWGCKPVDAAPSGADALALRIRLDASDAKIAALEAKLGDTATKLDDAVTKLDTATLAIEGLTRGAAELDAMPPDVPVDADPPTVDRATLFDSFQTDEGATGPIRCKMHDDARATCTIERMYMADLVTKPAELARQARVVPAVAGGRTRGFKLYGVRPDSLPSRLGLKNGDQITSVDGRTLASLDDTMEIMAKAMRADEFVLGLERKGEPFSLEIVVE